MKLPRLVLGSIQTCILVAAATSLQSEQVQTGGTPGSPGATTTITGKQVPLPDSKFGGLIKDDAMQLKYWFTARIVPPKEAPQSHV